MVIQGDQLLALSRLSDQSLAFGMPEPADERQINPSCNWLSRMGLGHKKTQVGW